jgi:hypothetical protein
MAYAPTSAWLVRREILEPHPVRRVDYHAREPVPCSGVARGGRLDERAGPQ